MGKREKVKRGWEDKQKTGRKRGRYLKKIVSSKSLVFVIYVTCLLTTTRIEGSVGVWETFSAKEIYRGYIPTTYHVVSTTPVQGLCDRSSIRELIFVSYCSAYEKPRAQAAEPIERSSTCSRRLRPSVPDVCSIPGGHSGCPYRSPGCITLNTS